MFDRASLVLSPTNTSFHDRGGYAPGGAEGLVGLGSCYHGGHGCGFAWFAYIGEDLVEMIDECPDDDPERP